MKKHNPIRHFIGYEDLFEQLGYKQFKPRIGSVGRALLEASKGQRSDNFLKRYWDSYFRQLRQEHKKGHEF